MQHKLCFFLGELLKLGITNMVHWCRFKETSWIGVVLSLGSPIPTCWIPIFSRVGFFKKKSFCQRVCPFCQFHWEILTSMKHNCPGFRWLIPICGWCFSSRSAQNTIYYPFWPLEAPTNSKHFLMDKHMKVPKMGLSPKSSIYRWIFPEINHPACYWDIPMA